jgi:hypothetical protein
MDARVWARSYRALLVDTFILALTEGRSLV